jgi:membrane protease YdiL (CAAX protease family)
MENRLLLRFLVAATAGAFVFQGLAIHTGLSGVGRVFLLAAMWTPALAALLSSRDSRALALRALRRFRPGHVPLGLAVGAAIPVVHELALWITGAGTWNATRFPIAPDGRGIAAAHHVGLVLGTGPQGWATFACNLAASLALGSILAAVVGGLGEELGWRAVLQPEATRRLGVVRGSLAVGVCWACWHLPVNLAGYNDDVHPILTSLVLFPIGVLSAALALGWLVQRTGSVWPAALAHGAHNTLSSGLLLEPGSWVADQAANLVAAAVIGLVFGSLLWRSQRRRNVPQPVATRAAA